MNIVVLSQNPMTKWSDYGKSLGHSVDVLNPNKLALSISSAKGHDKLYSEKVRILKKNVDVVVVRMGGAGLYSKHVLDHLTECFKTPATATATGIGICGNQFKTLQKLSNARIRTPRTYFMQRYEDLEMLVHQSGFSFPFIMKRISGSQGAGVFMIRDKKELKLLLRLTKNNKIGLIAQEFIPTTNTEGMKHTDIRIWVINGQVVAAMRRFAKAGDFRANASISGDAEKVHPTWDQKQMAINAAKAVGLEKGVCGVDIITNIETEKDYVIEVNSCPGTKYINKVSDKNMIHEVMDFAISIGHSTKRENKQTKITPVQSIFTEAEYNQKSWQFFESNVNNEQTVSQDVTESDKEFMRLRGYFTSFVNDKDL